MEHERQIFMAISWYLWLGAIFRVPLSTTRRRTGDASLDSLDVVSKCRVLFIRFRTQGKKSWSLTTEWLKVWTLWSPKGNPPAHTG